MRPRVVGAALGAAVVGIGIGVYVACACTVPLPSGGGGGGGGPAPCTPTNFNPSNPAASGYQLVFSDNFQVSGTSTIDKTNSQASGFKWYVQPYFTPTPEPSTAFTSDSNGLILTPLYNTGPGLAMSTLLNSTPNWKGTLFSGGAYFEINMAFDGPNVATCFNLYGGGACGWPAFWTMAFEHDMNDRATRDQWPGQAAGYEHFMENDFFEYDIPTVGNGAGWGSGKWDWSGIYNNSTCTGYSTGSPGNGYCGLLNNGSPQLPNNVFLCGTAGCPAVAWNATTFHTLGNLWVAGDSNNGNIGYSRTFFDGAEAVTNGGGASSKVSWTDGSMPAPASLPGSPEVWSIHDSKHFPVIIGSGNYNNQTGGHTMPLHVKYVNVWQIPGCGVVTASGAPTITSPTTLACTVGLPCSYQITSDDSPTIFGASPLPVGMSVNASTGLISGIPSTSGVTNSTITASNGAVGSQALAITVANTPGFFVSTTGNDSNAGTQAAPFASFAKCQSAMQGSSTKVCYVRAGSYAPAAGPVCGSGNCVLGMGTADNGETWSYWPPDGYNSADIAGGSTASGNGLWAFINLGGVSNLTWNGIQIHHFDFAGITGLSNAPNLTVKNSIFHDMFFIVASGPQNAAAVQCYSCSNAIISHNVVHDIASFGISISGGGTNNLLYDSNVLWNTCTQMRDCGALYTQDLPQTSTGQRAINNYVWDGCTFSGCGPGSGGWGAAMYLDDCASNWTVSGNVFRSQSGSNNTIIHGGHNNVWTNNIIDLATQGEPIFRFQSSSCAAVTGNSLGGNIVISNGAAGGYNGISGTVTVPTSTSSENLYWNYGTGTLSSSGDSTPVTGSDPNLTCYAYNIASNSPARIPPVSFPDLTRGWGPPGFAIPTTIGTPPSQPHGC